MEPELRLVLLGVLVSVSLFIVGLRNIEASSRRAQYAQVLLTILAFSTTAYWFFVERKGMPHADVSQTIHMVPLGGGLAAVEAHIQIRNLGQRLLKVRHVNSRLQTVRPDAYDYVGLNAKLGDEHWRATRPSSDAKQFHGSELRWPILREYNEGVKHEIEPGETDLIVVTYLIHCTEFTWVRVASDILNSTAENSLAWKTRSFANTHDVCFDSTGEAA